MLRARPKYSSRLRAHLAATRRQEERRRINAFVTISRQPGAYGLTIAERLSAFLRAREKRLRSPWTVFDRDLMRRVVEDNQIPPEVMPYLEESPIGEINDMIEELFGLHPSKWRLVHMMSRTILQIAIGGGVIFVGRAANVVTRHLPGGVHLRLVGSYAARLHHVMEHKDMTESEAGAFIRTEEKNRAEYLKKYFSKDIDDPLLYDLVFNTDTVPIERIVAMTGDFILKGGFRREAPAD